MFALLKEEGQFFEDGVWTNKERGMASLAPRLCKNYAWAVDASNRQAPVPAHLADYRLAFGVGATDTGVRAWIFQRAAASPSTSPPAPSAEGVAMVAGGVAAAADAEAAAAARPVEVATERGPAWAAMPTPTATPTTAGAPPAVTPAAAAKPQSAASGASSSSSVKMRKPEEGAWGSNKKSKGAQPTLAYRLYRSTGSDSLTLQLEHLAARDKLLAIFNVSESTVEVRVKRRPVLPQQPLLLHSGGGFEAHETNSWREEDHLTSGPLALHKLGSEWALDGKELGKASGTGESDATSYEIGRSKLVTHRLLHVADGGGGAQLTVPLLRKKTIVEQEECTPSPPARMRSRTPVAASSST